MWKSLFLYEIGDKATELLTFKSTSKGGTTMGGFKYRVKKVDMDLHKRKVEGYKVQLVNDSIIEEEKVVRYAAQSAGIPESMMRACTIAIADAIRFYVINGHKVSFGKFGNFRLKVENTCVDRLEECQADTVKRINLHFTPSTKIKDLLNKAELKKWDFLSESASSEENQSEE